VTDESVSTLGSPAKQKGNKQGPPLSFSKEDLSAVKLCGCQPPPSATTGVLGVNNTSPHTAQRQRRMGRHHFSSSSRPSSCTIKQPKPLRVWGSANNVYIKSSLYHTSVSKVVVGEENSQKLKGLPKKKKCFRHHKMSYHTQSEEAKERNQRNPK